MNITEKILARASKKSSVSPDDVIFADIDCAMVHDVSGPGVIKVFEKLEKQGIDVPPNSGIQTRYGSPKIISCHLLKKHQLPTWQSLKNL